MKGEGPTLVEIMTYRVTGHSATDNDLDYRTKEEVDEHKNKDSLSDYKQYLVEAGLWSDEQEAVLQTEIRAVINEANEYAEKAPYQAVEDSFRYVYAEEVEEGH